MPQPWVLVWVNTVHTDVASRKFKEPVKEIISLAVVAYTYDASANGAKMIAVKLRPL